MDDTTEKTHKSDQIEIEDLLEDIGVRNINPTHYRLGIKKDHRSKRPIKVVFQNQQNKDLVMNNLHKLKDSGYPYVSVRDDFTINERRKIKDLYEEAKKKNEENSGDLIWCVRGSPRTSLRLVKRPKKSYKQKFAGQEIQYDSLSSDDDDDL